MLFLPKPFYQLNLFSTQYIFFMVPWMIIYKSRPFLLVGQSSYFFENAEIFCMEKFITAHLFEPVRLEVLFYQSFFYHFFFTLENKSIVCKIVSKFCCCECEVTLNYLRYFLQFSLIDHSTRRMTIELSHFNQKVQIVKGKWSTFNALRSEPCCILFCS